MEYSQEVEDVVCRVAKSVASAWRGMLDYDDLHQELWMFILERPSVQGRKLDKLEQLLRWQANALCKREQVDYDHFSGNFQYTPRDVREMAVSLEECSGTEEEQADYDLGIEILWKYKPEKFEDLIDWFERGDEWDKSSSTVRSRIQYMFDALTDAMNEVRKARLRERTEGPGTKPRDPKPPVPVNDWDIYKQGVANNG